MPTAVSGSRTNRSAMRRRNWLVAAPTAKKLAPTMTLVQKTALLAPTAIKVIKALNESAVFTALSCSVHLEMSLHWYSLPDLIP
ncbi:hypothetical protein O9992_09050 [Vibrio lentus]|nr:hypothetical protein [Vibrio lentus]